MGPTLQALQDLGGSAHIDEIAAQVIEIAQLTEDQLSIPHFAKGRATSQSEIAYRLAWTRTHLKLIAAVENSSRGVWSLTASGWNLSASEAEELSRQRRRDIYPRSPKSTSDGNAESDDGDDELEPENKWKMSLLSKLAAITPEAFERLSQRLLREAGFSNVTVLGKSGDGGIDGAGLYRASLVSFPVYFQCKRWQNAVTPKEVRDFRGAMTGRGEKGLIITTSSFTSKAKDEATRDGAPLVDLVDGDELCELLRTYGLGVEVIQVTKINPKFFDSI